MLFAAESSMNSTPQYINEPVFSNWDYQIEHHNKNAIIKIALTIIDIITGTFLYNDTIEEQQAASDYLIENANPSAGVQPKSLEIDSDDKMKEQILRNATKKLITNAKQSLSNFGIRYYATAEKERSNGQLEDAVENYIKFLYSFSETEGENNENYKKVKAYLGISSIQGQQL
jgi:hypothetical protein